MTSPTNVYHLACHCQTHVLRLTLPDGAKFDDNDVCDCSHCLKRRIVWHSAPAGSLEIVRGLGKDGAEQLNEYRFGAKNAGHKFCGKCGTHLLGQDFDPSKTIMVNMRAIRDPHFDLRSLPLTNRYSGLDRGTPYEPVSLAQLPGAAEYLEERSKAYKHETRTYIGSCHCQAVKFAVRCKPLEEVSMMDCSCSICLGNGAIWVYPGRINTFFYPHTDAPYEPASGLMTKYTFSRGINGHFTCRTCGCHVFEYAERPIDDPRPPAVRAAKPVWEPENGWNGSFGLNIALLNDAGAYLADVHGLGADNSTEEGRKGTVLKGLSRDIDGKTEDPVYKLHL